MSNYSFSKEELQEIETYPLEEFIVGYELRVSEMLEHLSKLVEKVKVHNKPLSERGLLHLRRLSVNVDHFSLIFRRNSIKRMKEKEMEKNEK